MAIDYWQPAESKKAKGYFIRREHRGEVQLGDVYHARLEDAQKACDRLNAMLENAERRRKEKWKELHNDKFRKPKTF